MKVAPIQSLPTGFDSLIHESLQEGHEFLSKMKTAWISGENQFNRRGEIVYAAFADIGNLIGICGLNIDPYANNAAIGRVRHLYVSNSQRKLGTGRALVEKVLSYGQSYFSMLRLRTENPVADKFYQAIGFKKSDNQNDCTHLWIY